MRGLKNMCSGRRLGLCAALVLALSAGSKVHSQVVQNIVFTNISSSVTAEKLTIDLDVMVRGLNVGRGGRIVLELAIEDAVRRVALPTIVYSGKLRTKLEKRRELLSDDYAPRSYYTYDRVKRRDSYNLHYRLSMPYQAWMATAGLTVREYTHDCSSERLTSTARLIEKFGGASVKVIYVVREVKVPTPASAAPKQEHRVQFEAPADCETCVEQARGVWEYRRKNRRGQ